MESTLLNGLSFTFITLAVTSLSSGQNCKWFNFGSVGNFLFPLRASENAFEEGEMSNRAHIPKLQNGFWENRKRFWLSIFQGSSKDNIWRFQEENQQMLVWVFII